MTATFATPQPNSTDGPAEGFGSSTDGPFPEALFTITGDPSALDADASAYDRFSGAATDTSAHLTNQIAETAMIWTGSEGNLYRTRIHEYPPMMDAGFTAFRALYSAVDAFSNTMATSQQSMRALHDEARTVWDRLQAAKAAAATAGSALADATRTAAASAATADSGTITAAAALAGAQQAASAADAALAAYTAQWLECCARARTIHGTMILAATDAAARINAAPAPPAIPSPASGGATPTSFDTTGANALPATQTSTAGIGDTIWGALNGIKNGIVDEARHSWEGAKATGQIGLGALEAAGAAATWAVDHDAGARLMAKAKNDLTEGGRNWMKDGNGLHFASWFIPYGKIGGLAGKFLINNPLGRGALDQLAAATGRLTARGIEWAHGAIPTLKGGINDKLVGLMGLSIPVGLEVRSLSPLGGLAIPQLTPVRATLGESAPHLRDLLLKRHVLIPGGEAYRSPQGKIFSEADLKTLPPAERSELKLVRGDSGRLGRNMQRNSLPKPTTEGKWEAHHIIPLREEACSALRARLLTLGVDLDSHHNGAWLIKSDVGGRMPGVGISHNRTFGRDYAQWVNERFRNVTTREDAHVEMTRIRDVLMQSGGEVPW